MIKSLLLAGRCLSAAVSVFAQSVNDLGPAVNAIEKSANPLIFALYALALAFTLGLGSTVLAARRGKRATASKQALSQEMLKVVAEAMEIVRTEYDTDLTAPGIARRLGVSERELRRLLKHENVKSLEGYLLETRLEHARQLLCGSSLDFVAVAQRVNYSDLSKFTRNFKKKFGQTPSQYRGSVRVSGPAVRRPANGDGIPRID